MIKELKCRGIKQSFLITYKEYECDLYNLLFLLVGIPSLCRFYLYSSKIHLAPVDVLGELYSIVI